jgi:arylsulfatase A-like enzyme
MARPNILIINSDQHRVDSLGCYGHDIVKTPNLDRLAAMGMRFDNAFTPAPLCCPARQSLLCSQVPEKHGCLWNYGAGSGHAMGGLPPETDVWPRRLQQAGYRTAYFGKWHVNPDVDPTGFGFEKYSGLENYPGRRPAKNSWNDLTDICGVGIYDEGETETSRTHASAYDCIATIKEYAEGDAPWHVRLDYTEPHLPCFPTREFLNMYDPDELAPWGSFDEELAEKPYIQKQQLDNWNIADWTWDDWKHYVHQYFAVITQMDDAIGKVIAYLEESGLIENTIIIYTTDHGDMAGGHRMMDKHYILYEDVVHVPMIIRWDGVTPPGSVDDDFTSHYLDLGPTLLEAAGLEIPDCYDGKSLLPRLRGEPVIGAEGITSTYNGQQFGLYTQRMYRDKRYKLVWNLTDIDEFYDLDSDPYELKNLIRKPECAGLIESFRQKLYHELLRLGDPLVESVWMREQLLYNRKKA